MEAGILIGLWLVLPLLILGCVLLQRYNDFSTFDLYVVGAAFLCGVLSTAAGVFIWQDGFTVNTSVTLCVAILCHSVLLVVVWRGSGSAPMAFFAAFVLPALSPIVAPVLLFTGKSRTGSRDLTPYD